MTDIAGSAGTHHQVDTKCGPIAANRCQTVRQRCHLHVVEHCEHRSDIVDDEHQLRIGGCVHRAPHIERFLEQTDDTFNTVGLALAYIGTRVRQIHKCTGDASVAVDHVQVEAVGSSGRCHRSAQ